MGTPGAILLDSSGNRRLDPSGNLLIYNTGGCACCGNPCGAPTCTPPTVFTLPAFGGTFNSAGSTAVFSIPFSTGSSFTMLDGTQVDCLYLQQPFFCYAVQATQSNFMYMNVTNPPAGWTSSLGAGYVILVDPYGLAITLYSLVKNNSQTCYAALFTAKICLGSRYILPGFYANGLYPKGTQFKASDGNLLEVVCDTGCLQILNGSEVPPLPSSISISNGPIINGLDAFAAVTAFGPSSSEPLPSPLVCDLGVGGYGSSWQPAGYNRTVQGLSWDGYSSAPGFGNSLWVGSTGSFIGACNAADIFGGEPFNLFFKSGLSSVAGTYNCVFPATGASSLTAS